MTGYVVFAHGSSVESANEAVRAAAAQMGARLKRQDEDQVIAGFLGGGRPDLSGAIGQLAARGVDRIIVIPYFLTLGLHLQRDLPELVKAAVADYPDLRIDVTPPLDGHPALVEVLLDRARSIQAGESA